MIYITSPFNICFKHIAPTCTAKCMFTLGNDDTTTFTLCMHGISCQSVWPSMTNHMFYTYWALLIGYFLVWRRFFFAKRCESIPSINQCLDQAILGQRQRNRCISKRAIISVAKSCLPSRRNSLLIPSIVKRDISQLIDWIHVEFGAFFKRHAILHAL